MYNSIICGGTFDRLHVGHMFFLDAVFAAGKHVVIGLTTDDYIKKNKANASVFTYEKRFSELEKFLLERGYMDRAEIFPISDVYGKSLDPSLSVDAIVVTEATQKGAEMINEKRKNCGLSPLSIVTVPLQKIAGIETISSTLIRSGIIGRMGEFFPNPQWTKKILVLPPDLRHVFHSPLGELLSKEIPDEYLVSPEKIICIGDATTKRFHDIGIIPKICVVDFLVEREKKYHSLDELGISESDSTFIVTNPAGYLTPDVWEKILQMHKFLQKESNMVLQVDGEEDLLVIPFALLMPLGWTIFYGQPHEGVIRLPITEELKLTMFHFLEKFTQQ